MHMSSCGQPGGGPVSFASRSASRAGQLREPVSAANPASSAGAARPCVRRVMLGVMDADLAERIEYVRDATTRLLVHLAAVPDSGRGAAVAVPRLDGRRGAHPRRAQRRRPAAQRRGRQARRNGAAVCQLGGACRRHRGRRRPADRRVDRRRGSRARRRSTAHGPASTPPRGIARCRITGWASGRSGIRPACGGARSRSTASIWPAPTTRATGPPRSCAYALSQTAGTVAGRLPPQVALDVSASDTAQHWTFGPASGGRVAVSGPSWAIAAWFAGRPGPVASSLSVTGGELTVLEPWR